MPPKIRELIAELERAGFINLGGKGSHRNYEHPAGSRVTLSGNLGADARKYQEILVKKALKRGTRQMKNPGDIYQKIIVWSEEDSCFIGTCPELFHGGVHGDDAIKVFIELNEVVDEWIEIFKKNGKPLPEPKKVTVLEAA